MKIEITSEAKVLIEGAFKKIPAIEPRQYQLNATQKALSYLLRDKAHSVLIESPTGSGKTIMALILCSIFAKRGMTIGWCAMRRNLLTQADKENIEKGFGLKLKLISMFDKNPPKVDVLVVDEAHHDATDSMARIHNIIKPKKIIGLSATPFRSDKAELAFEATVAEAGIFQLIREGFLALVDHYTVPDWQPSTVCKTYLENPKKWGKSVMFFHTQDDCDEACEILENEGVKAAVVNGSTDKNAQIDAFEEGKFDVLINMIILTEGFDCPALETVFVRPSNDLVTAQMCGRVLRKFKGIAKKIVQSKDTSNPFPKFAPIATQFLWNKGIWNKITPDMAKINDIISNMDSQVMASDGDNNEMLSLIASFSKKKSGKGKKGSRTMGSFNDKELAQRLTNKE